MTCPFKSPTDKQLKYANYLQSFISANDDLSLMSKKELSDYINRIKPIAEEIIDEVSFNTNVVW
ncbi:hypothetical protein [Staphylococcus chromogenes]|uniref:hypothetical protein n=1 Tax=Staphylococcus chromogenes TaxID=46126 RepID=UPI002900CCAE|nr:hypothetical protein [Staphylococcus chromogenes]MDU0452309.1 hypothetical protein [Staphylococcus chromogenes]